MTLTELQASLRNISEEIAVLNAEIEKIKPKSEEENKKIFEQISFLAKQNPLCRETIKKAPEDVKKLMFTIFSWFIQADKAGQEERLLYLSRISIGSCYEEATENLVQLGMKFESSILNRIKPELKEYKYTFMTEIFILMNLSKDGKEKMQEIAADLANMLECDKEELTVISFVAKSVLLNNPDILLSMPVPTKNPWKEQLREYVPKSWREKQRQLIKKVRVRYPIVYFNYQPCTYQKDIIEGAIYKKNDIICECSVISYRSPFLTFRRITAQINGEKLPSTSSEEYKKCNKIVTAPCDGIAYSFYKQYEPIETDYSEAYQKYAIDRYFYMVSYFDTREDLATWHYRQVKDS